MLIGIDARSALGEKAGIGTYMYMLIKYLAKIDDKNEYYIYVNQPAELNLTNPRFKIKIYTLPTIFWHFRVLIDLIVSKVDIYHTASMIVPVFLKNRCSLFIPDLTPYLFPQYHTIKTKLSKLLYNRAIHKARVIITISLNSQKDIVNLFTIPAEKVKVIYLAAGEEFKQIKDDDYLTQVRTKFNLPAQYLLFVGSIEPRKNLNGVIEAYRIIKNQIKHRLVIVGGKGWLNSVIYKKIAENNLQEQIIFTGYVSITDLVALYNMAELFIYPSHYEGFGIPVLEAMVCGVPVISSNTSALPEIIGDAGIMVNPNDIDTLAEIIFTTIQNKNLRTQLVQKGLMQVKRFSWDNTAHATLSFWQIGE